MTFVHCHAVVRMNHERRLHGTANIVLTIVDDVTRPEYAKYL
jgi:hypothetical protein